MSAILPLQVALDAAIKGDAVLSVKLRGEKVYSLRAPSSDNDLPYIMLGQSTENAERTFDRRGYRGVEMVTAWSADVTKFEAAGIAADLERLLDGKTLTLNGVRFCVGTFTVLMVTLDQAGKFSMAACRYEVLSFA